MTDENKKMKAPAPARAAGQHTPMPRPIFRTKFSVTEELYPSPAAKEPCYSRTLRANFGLDLRRVATLCGGLLILSIAAVIAMRK